MHIFIEQLADMTPHEAATLVEEIARILRTLPQKLFFQMSADDPEFVEGNTSSHAVEPLQHVIKHSWN